MPPAERINRAKAHMGAGDYPRAQCEAFIAIADMLAGLASVAIEAIGSMSDKP
jgi:hypothetical protein